MAWGRAAIYGTLDAIPFALGLGFVVLTVGDAFAPGRLLAISVLLGGGIGVLLAMISASRYVADGKRFWLLWNATELAAWWA